MWLIATALLFLPGIHFWTGPKAPPIRKPETPLDLMRPEAAAHWRFARAAGPHLPPRSTYTVTAPTRDEEMSVFMISVGLITHATGLATSYFSVHHPQFGNRAEYILAYACAGAEPTAQLVTYAPGGCVFRRSRL